MGEAVGSVTALWRFPVKSMAGERMQAAEVTDRGFVGDRAYACIDAKTGKVLSAKTPKLGSELLGCRAAFVGPPQKGQESPPVRITLSDGSSVTSDSPQADGTLSELFGRKVKLASAAPEDFTIDQYHPDLEGLDPEGHRDTVTESKLGSAYFAEAGLPSAVPVGAFFDLFPVSVMTTSTLDGLGQLEPDSRFDQRRFRMNVMVATEGDGFLENEWVGRSLEIGDGVRLNVVIPDPLANLFLEGSLGEFYPELKRDRAGLERLVRGFSWPGGFPSHLTPGTPGTIHEGDSVSIA